MKKTQTIIALILVGLSITIYSLKTIIVGDIAGTQKFLFNAMGVLPINLLLMTFIFNKLLTWHTRKSQVQKRNMLMNAFFSEFGNSLLKKMAELDTTKEALYKCSKDSVSWDGEGLSTLQSYFNSYEADLSMGIADLREIKAILNTEHQFLLTLLQHPAMNAHEKFSDLVWALFHLEDELNHRDGHVDLPETDVKHLTVDLTRVYNHLISQWVDYMIYLKDHYPYLYSLAFRTSPFTDQSKAVIY